MVNAHSIVNRIIGRDVSKNNKRKKDEDLDYCPECGSVMVFKDCRECGWKG